MAEIHLTKADKRLRQRILHRIHRYLTGEHPDKVNAYDAFYKQIVFEAITTVLATERLAVEALAKKLKVD